MSGRLAAHSLGTGSPRSHPTLRRLGAEPVDYRDPALVDRVRELAPNGVDAVFDNIGGAGFQRSFRQPAPGGTLVGYGVASQLEDSNNMLIAFAGIMSRFALWSALPNGGRSATVYYFWGGKRVSPTRFRERLAADLDSVRTLVEQAAVTPHVAARIPLREAGRALALAESGTARGKVVLIP